MSIGVMCRPFISVIEKTVPSHTDGGRVQNRPSEQNYFSPAFTV